LRERQNLWQRIPFLRELNRPQLRDAIQTALTQPDVALTTLFNELDVLEQKRLASEVSGQTPPGIANVEAAIANLNQKIDAKVDGIMLGLENRLEATQASLKELESRIESTKANDLSILERSRPYYEAKQRLADQLVFVEILAKKIDAEREDLMRPRESPVLITRKAESDPHPISPNRTAASMLIIAGPCSSFLAAEC
jgi:hypothetical protein